MPGGTVGTVPTFATEVPGNFLTAALWLASVQQGAGWMINARPVFHGFQAVAQSFTTVVSAAFLLDSEDYDTDGGHSTSTNTSRFTPQTPGTYLVIGSSGWAANATGFRRVWLQKNGTALIGTGLGVDAGTANICGGLCMAFVVLNGTTDYVEVWGQQGSGGSLLSSVAGQFVPSMSAIWLRS
jgi:hypothetical protein